VKFKAFKDNYHKLPAVRLEALAKIKEVYLDKQANVLASNLQREVESIGGSPAKVRVTKAERKGELMDQMYSSSAKKSVVG
jgi:hypothetical protein